MARVSFSLAGNEFTVDGPDVSLLSDVPAPFSVVADFLDSIDVAAFRKLVESELEMADLSQNPVDIVLRVLRDVVSGA